MSIDNLHQFIMPPRKNSIFLAQGLFHLLELVSEFLSHGSFKFWLEYLNMLFVEPHFLHSLVESVNQGITLFKGFGLGDPLNVVIDSAAAVLHRLDFCVFELNYFHQLSNLLLMGLSPHFQLPFTKKHHLSAKIVDELIQIFISRDNTRTWG